VEYQEAKIKKEKEELKRKALEPQEVFCKILQKKITVLIEYTDYRGVNYPLKQNEIFCSNMLECYQNNIKCKYSGISKFFPDPFDKNFTDEFYKEYVGKKEFQKILKLRKQNKST